MARSVCVCEHFHVLKIMIYIVSYVHLQILLKHLCTNSIKQMLCLKYRFQVTEKFTSFSMFFIWYVIHSVYSLFINLNMYSSRNMWPGLTIDLFKRICLIVISKYQCYCWCCMPSVKRIMYSMHKLMPMIVWFQHEIDS